MKIRLFVLVFLLLPISLLNTTSSTSHNPIISTATPKQTTDQWISFDNSSVKIISDTTNAGLISDLNLSFSANFEKQVRLSIKLLIQPANVSTDQLLSDPAYGNLVIPLEREWYTATTENFTYPVHGEDLYLTRLDAPVNFILQFTMSDLSSVQTYQTDPISTMYLHYADFVPPYFHLNYDSILYQLQDDNLTHAEPSCGCAKLIRIDHSVLLDISDEIAVQYQILLYQASTNTTIRLDTSGPISITRTELGLATKVVTFHSLTTAIDGDYDVVYRMNLVKYVDKYSNSRINKPNYEVSIPLNQILSSSALQSQDVQLHLQSVSKHFDTVNQLDYLALPYVFNSSLDPVIDSSISIQYNEIYSFIQRVDYNSKTFTLLLPANMIGISKIQNFTIDYYVLYHELGREFSKHIYHHETVDFSSLKISTSMISNIVSNISLPATQPYSSFSFNLDFSLRNSTSKDANAGLYYGVIMKNVALLTYSAIGRPFDLVYAGDYHYVFTETGKQLHDSAVSDYIPDVSRALVFFSGWLHYGFYINDTYVGLVIDLMSHQPVPLQSLDPNADPNIPLVAELSRIPTTATTKITTVSVSGIRPIPYPMTFMGIALLVSIIITRKKQNRK